MAGIACVDSGDLADAQRPVDAIRAGESAVRAHVDVHKPTRTVEQIAVVAGVTRDFAHRAGGECAVDQVHNHRIKGSLN